MSAEQLEKKKKQIIKSLEEDDEFEDFQAEDWTQQETVGVEGQKALWVEDWDDNDVDDNFSKELKEELSKVAASKK